MSSRKAAPVTGSASGIDVGIANALAARGSSVNLTASFHTIRRAAGDKGAEAGPDAQNECRRVAGPGMTTR
jgi:NAD(P)-dependent dehydrogenase (short-subunit alcohol dehydrogenase family)